MPSTAHPNDPSLPTAERGRILVMRSSIQSFTSDRESKTFSPHSGSKKVLRPECRERKVLKTCRNSLSVTSLLYQTFLTFGVDFLSSSTLEAKVHFQLCRPETRRFLIQSHELSRLATRVLRVHLASPSSPTAVSHGPRYYLAPPFPDAYSGLLSGDDERDVHQEPVQILQPLPR
jgi:hypothetical protein